MASVGPQYGSLGRQFFLHLTWLPQLITEWAALIPLILHLAAPTYDHKLAGRACLDGWVNVGIFPRLGTATSIANLLEQGSDFLDRTATDSQSSLWVWDIMWGSRFPCVNGAASTILASEASRVRRRVERVSNSARKDIQREEVGREKRGAQKDLALCRPQVLNIYSCSQAARGPTHLQAVKLWHHVLKATGAVVVAGGVIVLCLYGLFGTAAAVVVGVLSKVACQYVHLGRTSEFLVSNELSGTTPGSVTGAMLVSAHCNATTWNLYVGDRGVIDALLNKPMVHLRRFPPVLWYWFKAADVLQLLAMTFAAAQKGWDGVAMVLLMFLDWTFELVTDRDSIVAQRFLRDNEIEMKSSQLFFKGRIPMLFAIHFCSNSPRSLWMDDIIVPAPRREELLRLLRPQPADLSTPPNPSSYTRAVTLSPSDKTWLSNNKKWTEAEIRRLKPFFATGIQV